jgi:predicted RNA-binding protein YlxR (DUF448 family)
VKRGGDRTCLGCRRVRPRGELVRLVSGGDGRVRVDPRGRAAGRGAYVCPDAACVERGLERGRLRHAFKTPCDADAAVVAAVRALAMLRGR